MLVRFLEKKMIHDPKIVFHFYVHHKEYCSSWPASAHVPEAPARTVIFRFLPWPHPQPPRHVVQEPPEIRVVIWETRGETPGDLPEIKDGELENPQKSTFHGKIIGKYGKYGSIHHKWM